MASIDRRVSPEGAVSYQVRVRLKGHPTQTATFARLTDARRWAQQTEAAIREGRHFKTTEANRRTLTDLVDRYLREVMPGKKSARGQGIQLCWWRAELGHHVLADITPALLAEYRDRLAAGITPKRQPRSGSTVNRYLAALSHAFTIATNEWLWLEDNPLRRVRKLKEPRGRVRFLSDEERCRLLAACKASGNSDLYPAVVLALSTGARQQEIMSLRWPDIDLTRGMIVVQESKNGERRALPLVAHAAELIRERGRVRRLNTDLVFPSARHPQQPIELRTPWQAALKQADIKDFKWHDLRHSAASYLAMNGATLAEIAAVLGHRTLAMVKRYAHLSEAHTARVIERMNRQIFGE